MPFLHLNFSAPGAADLLACVAMALLDLPTQVLHKQAAHSAVRLGYVDPTQWFIGAKAWSVEV